jgi:hypothetical protein
MRMTTQIQLSIQQIADRLVELCRQGRFEMAQKELYADNLFSIELHDNPINKKKLKSLQSIIEKGKRLEEMIEEVHEFTVSDPIVVGNCIVFEMSYDLTMKDQNRLNWKELCVYRVKNGKIMYEQFFN